MRCPLVGDQAGGKIRGFVTPLVKFKMHQLKTLIEKKDKLIVKIFRQQNPGLGKSVC